MELKSGRIDSIKPVGYYHLYAEASEVKYYGVGYRVSAHLYKHSDGVWRIGSESDTPGNRERNAFYMCRIGTLDCPGAYSAAWKKAFPEFEKALAEWAESHSEEIEAERVEERKRAYEYRAESLRKLEEARKLLVDEMSRLEGGEDLPRYGKLRLEIEVR